LYLMTECLITNHFKIKQVFTQFHPSTEPEFMWTGRTSL
jgi:hypothetical protein